MQIILMDYPKVTGEVTISGYEDYIALDSFDMGTSDAESRTSSDDDTSNARGSGGKIAQPGYGDGFDAMDMGGGQGGPRVKRVGIDSVSVSKAVDQATPQLLQLAFTKRTGDGDKVKIIIFRSFERASGGGGIKTVSIGATGLSFSGDEVPWHEPFMTVTLEGTHVSGHKVTIAKEALTETVELSFKKLTMEYIVYKNGKRIGKISKTIDVAKQE